VVGKVVSGAVGSGFSPLRGFKAALDPFSTPQDGGASIQVDGEQGFSQGPRSGGGHPCSWLKALMSVGSIFLRFCVSSFHRAFSKHTPPS